MEKVEGRGVTPAHVRRDQQAQLASCSLHWQFAQSHSPVAVQLQSLVAHDAHLHSPPPGWQVQFED
jgi:hypothetical protein